MVATAAATIITGFLFALGAGHRLGRTDVLDRAGAFAERQSGLPGWAALPAAVITGALIVALFGMFWDISIHIDEGRDEGPLANPAHYFILFGLFGVFAAGFLAIVMPKERPGPTAVRISGDWYAPLGGIMIAACGAFSLIGFPLDDVWHRLFGQDVTLWGPTHLMLIGGAAMTLIGLAVLLVEGGRANVAAGRAEAGREFARWIRQVSLTGAFLLGLSTFQAEFDFGVPQFRFVFAPMLVMLAAGVALVAARVWLGRGAALGAALFFIAIRGVIALIVGPILGESLPHFPLYLAGALLVERSRWSSPTRRPLAFGLAAGAAIGTLGLAAEWAWTHVFSPIPWPSELFPEGAVLGFAMAIAGSLLGAWMGARLASDHVPRTAGLRNAACLAAAAVAALVGYALYKPADEGVRGTISIAEAPSDAGREGNVAVQLDPPDAADGAEWLQAISWQGGGLVLDDLRPTGEPGGYETTEPVPLYGNWKTMIRLHTRRLAHGDPDLPAQGRRDPGPRGSGHRRRDPRVHRRPRDPPARAEDRCGLAVGRRLRPRARDHPGLPRAAGLEPAPPGEGRRALRATAFRGPALAGPGRLADRGDAMTVLPVAHHALVTALPFVLPMLVIVGGLIALAVRDRLGGGPHDDAEGDAPRSPA